MGQGTNQIYCVVLMMFVQFLFEITKFIMILVIYHVIAVHKWLLIHWPHTKFCLYNLTQQNRQTFQQTYQVWIWVPMLLQFFDSWLSCLLCSMTGLASSTSGGCDIQSYFVCDACNGGTKSAELSLDPFNEYITLPTYFVNQKYIVLNSQLLAFVPRLRTDSNVGSIAIGRYIKDIANIKQAAIALDWETMIDATIGRESYTSEACILLPDHDPEVCICQEGET